MAFQSIRDKMNQNQKPFIIGGIVIVCAAVALVVWELKPASTISAPSSYYFYDTSNGTVKVEPVTAIPPLKGHDGRRTLVLAEFFTCTTCGDRKISYLVKYTARARAAKKLLGEPLPADASPIQKSQHAADIASLRMSVADGKLVRLPAKGSPWISAMSFQGLELIRRASRCPGGRYARPCLP